MKRAMMLSVALTLAVPAPAWASRGGGNGSGDNECGRNGGCNNERDENYSGAGCKYACPSFDKSPVQDSFNIQICVQPGSCTAKDDKKESK